MFELGDTIRHRNGTLYEVVKLPEHVVIESNAAPAYAYRRYNGDDQRWWIRPATEMEDGRFTLEKRAA